MNSAKVITTPPPGWQWANSYQAFVPEGQTEESTNRFWVRHFPNTQHEWGGLSEKRAKIPGWYACGRSMDNWTWVAEPDTPVADACAIALVVSKLD